MTSSSAHPQPDEPQRAGSQPTAVIPLPPRPPVVNLAAGLLVLSALPWLLILGGETFTSGAGSTPGGGRANSSGGLLVLNILFIVFVMRARAGRNWARIAVTVMTALYAYPLLQIVFVVSRLVGGEAGPFVIVVALWTLLLSIGGLVLIYSKAANAYLARRR